jgi:hypothetical protein
VEIITVVEGKVPASKSAEFEATYASLKREPVTPGQVKSSLLRNGKDLEIYRIETVWQDREALEKMRSSPQTPKALELFRKIGVSPNLEMYIVVDDLH